jgi:hypothetical protein
MNIRPKNRTIITKDGGDLLRRPKNRQVELRADGGDVHSKAQWLRFGPYTALISRALELISNRECIA